MRRLVDLPSLGDEAAAAALEADVRMVARSVTRLARATRAQVATRPFRNPEYWLAYLRHESRPGEPGYGSPQRRTERA